MTERAAGTTGTVRLAFTGGSRRGESVQLGGEAVIGRDESADLVLKVDDRVSRRHARIGLDGDALTIEDLNSSNGTFVDERKIQSGTPVELQPGQTVRIGGTTFTLAREESNGQGQAPPPPRRKGDAPVARLVASSGALKGQTIELQPGQRKTFGRDSDNDVVVADDNASRHHAVVSADAGGRVTVEDHNSANGVYVDGKKITGTAALAPRGKLRIGSSVLSLEQEAPVADKTEPITGPRPWPKEPTQPQRAPGESVIIRLQRSLRRTTIGAIAAIVTIILAGAAVGALFATGVIGGSSSTGLSSGDIHKLEQATVHIEAVSKDSGPLLFGSGTIINPHGLILTNAHVGEPDAPGRAVENGGPLPAEESPHADGLLISTFTSEDQPAKPSYIGKVVKVDGYLDVALVQIVADAKGNQVDPNSLDLPYVKLGDSDKLEDHDNVTVIGYPGVGGGEERRINSATGSVSGFIPEARVKQRRAWIKTDAQIASGNSGGLAANDKDEIVGIPTQVVCDQPCDPKSPFHDLQGRIRAINVAMPVIQAALSGSAYASPYFINGSGQETFDFQGWASTEPDDSCRANVAEGGQFDANATELWAVWNVSGMTNGEDYSVRWLYVPTGGDPESDKQLASTDFAKWKLGPSVTCFARGLTINAGDTGTYGVQIAAGGSLNKGDQQQAIVGSK